MGNDVPKKIELVTSPKRNKQLADERRRLAAKFKRTPEEEVRFQQLQAYFRTYRELLRDVLER